MAGAGGPGGAAGGADTSPAALMATGGTGRSGRRSATAAGTAAALALALPLPGGAGAAAPPPGQRGSCGSEGYRFESRPRPVRGTGLDCAGVGFNSSAACGHLGSCSWTRLCSKVPRDGMGATGRNMPRKFHLEMRKSFFAVQ